MKRMSPLSELSSVVMQKEDTIDLQDLKIQSATSLPSFLGPHWLGMVELCSILSMGQIELWLMTYNKLNW